MEGRMEILRVLIGSRAHGLARDDSDYDYRAVHIDPLRSIVKDELTVGGKHTATSMGEGQDFVSYEIGHFLKLAMKCNPSILEVFKAPVVSETTYTFPDWPNTRLREQWHADSLPLGAELRLLFPFVWSGAGVHGAFLGYAKNQVRKLMDDTEGPRASKYALAALRAVVQAEQLLVTGDLSVEISDEWKPYFFRIRDGDMELDAFWRLYADRRQAVHREFDNMLIRKGNIKAVVDWLERVRRAT